MPIEHIYVVEWKPQSFAEAGELARLPHEVLTRINPVELGAVLADPERYQRDPSDITVFKSVGIGLADVALAHHVYKRVTTSSEERSVSVS